MAKLRNVQFLRNSVLVDSRSTAITKMEEQLTSLKDGELIIGRYTEGEGESQVVRSVIGVAYINESGSRLEIIPDNQISDIIKALANSGETIAAKNDEGIVTIYKTITEANGIIKIDTEAEANQIKLAKVATTGKAVDVTTATVEGATYTTSDLTSQNWKTVVEENALATTDDVETSVEKLDTKIAGLADELIADEQVIKDSFKSVKEGVGLNDDFTASFENALTAELRDDTSVKQAIYTLESKLVNTSNTTIDGHKGNITTGNGITDVTTDGGSFAVKPKDGGYISVTSDGVDVKNVDTNGNSTTATDLATVKTVTEHINALDTTTDVQAVTLTDATTTTGAKLVFNGVKEVNGVIAAGSLTRGLDLALVATTGESKDVAKTTDSTATYDTTTTEISDAWISVVNGNKLQDGDTVDADLNKLDNKIAGLANELIVDEKAISTSLTSVKNALGATDTMTMDFSDLSGDEAKTKTNVHDAIKAVEDEISAASITIDGQVGEITSGNGLKPITAANKAMSVKAKANDYVKVDADGVQIDASKVDSAYTTTNTTNLATVNTVKTAIEGLDVTTAVQAMTQSTDATSGDVTLTFKGVKETDGKIAQGDAENPDTLVLKKVATTGEAEDVAKTSNSTAVYDTEATEISDTWISVVNDNKLADGDTVDADLNKLDNKIAGLADELIGDENVINNTFDAVQTAVGLSDDFTLDITGTNYINGDNTNVKDALTTLDGEIKSINDDIDGMYMGNTPMVFVAADNKTVNGATIKEDNGKVSLVTNTTLFSFNQEVSSTNKAATMSDITAASITVSDETENAVSVAKTNNDYKVTLGINTSDKVLTQSANGLIANLTMTYGDVTEGEGATARTYKAIQLKGKENSVISTIDATNFLKDGMLDSVELTTNPEGQAAGTYLHFVFNTESGKEDIYVNVTSLIDAYKADEVYLTLEGGKTFKHKLTTNDNSSYTRGTDTTSAEYGGTNTIKVPSIKVDAAGHVTSISDADVTFKMPEKQTASDALSIAVENNVATISDTFTLDGTAQDATTVTLTGEKDIQIVVDGTNGAKIGHSTTSESATQTGAITFTDTALSQEISVPVLTIDTYGHVTKNQQTTYTITLPASIASAVQTVKGKADKDQRDNLNNLDYVNVKATKTGTTVELESSVKTQTLEDITPEWTFDSYYPVANLVVGDAVCSRNNITTGWNTVIVDGHTLYLIETEEQLNAFKADFSEGAHFECAKHNTATDVDGLTTAVNVKNYIDSHEPIVKGSTNVTVTPSTEGNHKVYTVSVDESIASAVQTVLGDTDTNDQRATALNNNEYVNVTAVRATNSNDVKLQSSVKTVNLENTGDTWEYDRTRDGLASFVNWELQNGKIVLLSNIPGLSETTDTWCGLPVQHDTVAIIGLGTRSNYVIIDTQEKLDTFSQNEGYDEHLSCEISTKTSTTTEDGIATAANVRTYIDTHETEVVEGSNVTVTPSVNALGAKVYTVSVANAQTTTVSETTGETTVTPTTGTNTTDYKVGLASVTCTKVEDTDNYTDATATHKRISSITVDAKGRVTGYTETTVTEDIDCGTF